MKLTKSLKIIILTFIAFVVSVVGVLMMDNTSAHAATVSNTFQMVKGAEIRLVGENTQNYGIRYVAKIHKDDESFNQTDKFYVMIIPAKWVETYSLTSGCDYYQILVEQNGKVAEGDNRTINIMESAPVLKGDYYEIKGSITNIKYANSYRDFFGIVYKTDANGANRVYAKFNEGENERSISHVASVALNDGGYSTNETNYLLGMVKNAYNAKKGNATATENLPTVTVAESVDLALEKDKTYQLTAPSNVPEDLGVEVKWTTSDENAATVENGLVTVKSDNATADIKVKVLGTEYQMASVIEDSTFLNGYDTEESIINLWNANKHADAYKNNADFVAQNKWHENVDDKVGVAAVNGYGNEIDLRFNRTIAELKNIGLDDDDKISITYKFTSTNTWGVNTTIFGVTSTISYPDTWYTREFTVAQIAAANTDLETFLNNAGSDSLKGVRLNIQIASASTLYVDSICITKVDADYVAPTFGEEFTIPTAKIIGSRGAILAYSNQATVTYNGSPLTVENGKFIAEPGDYNINYAITYGGEEYTKEISFTVARTMANNMLEDFDSALSVSNLWNSYSSITQEQKDQNKWHESYTDKNSVTKTGVVSVNSVGMSINVKFNKTLAELKALGLDENDTICLTMLWTRTAGTYVTNIAVFGVSQDAHELNKWYNVEISVADIIANNTDLDTFFAKACSDGTGVTITNNIGSSATLYLAEISFVKNA